MKQSSPKSSLSEKKAMIKKNGIIFLPPLLLFIGFFFAVIFQGEQFCARDSANFYYPLFQQIQNEWDAGRFPGWDPYDNLGQPLAANPTSSVYYPVKILFFLPKLTGNFISYDFCFKWFILFHYILAFSGMFWLLRLRKKSRTAAIFAAVAYTFSGPVFFQYCNIIFLLGAAWFPWGIGTGLNLLARRNFGSVVALAFVLTLCLLGGEPQTVYLLGLVLVFYAFLSRKQINPSQRKEPKQKPFQSFFTSCLYLLAAALLAILLSAAQLIPGREMARQCERFSDSAPHSLWGLIGWKNSPKTTLTSGNKQKQLSQRDSIPQPALPSNNELKMKDPEMSNKYPENVSPWDNILCRNVKGSGHQGSIYNFSLAPWRTLEMAWPNVGGDYTKRSDRWFCLLPHDEDLWTPTVYFGILSLFLGFLGFNLFPRRNFRKHYRFIHNVRHSAPASGKRSSPSDRSGILNSNQTNSRVPAAQYCFTENDSGIKDENSLRIWTGRLFWIFLAASFGGFGIVWFVRVVAALTGHDQTISLQAGDPLGGIYWLMNLLLPGFSLFRYPAKLMTFAVFFLAFSAGMFFDYFCAVIYRYRRLSDSKNNSRSQILTTNHDCQTPKNKVPNQNAARPKKLVRCRKEEVPATNDVVLQLRKKSLKKIKTALWIFGILSILGALLTFYFFRMLNTCGSGFLQAPIVLGLFLLILGKVKRKEFIPFLILLLLAGDLYWANARYVHSMPERNYHQIPLIADSIEKDLKANNSCLSESVKTRIYRMIDWNPGSLVSDVHRIQKGAIWDQKTLAPKYGYPRGFCSANAQGTMINADYAKFIEKLGVKFHENLQNPELPKLLRTLGIDYMILPYRNFKDAPLRIQESQLLDEKTPRQFSFVSQTKDFLKEINQEWPVNTLLWKLDNPQPRIHLLRAPQKDETLQITRFLPGRIEFDANLINSASLEISEQFWPGWKATAQDQTGAVLEIPIEREKEILRRITLPAGKFHIVMRYEPSENKTGQTISLLTLSILAISPIILWHFRRRKQKTPML